MRWVVRDPGYTYSPSYNLFISSQGRREAWRVREGLGELGWTSLALEGLAVGREDAVYLTMMYI